MLLECKDLLPGPVAQSKIISVLLSFVNGHSDPKHRCVCVMLSVCVCGVCVCVCLWCVVCLCVSCDVCVHVYVHKGHVTVHTKFLLFQPDARS